MPIQKIEIDSTAKRLLLVTIGLAAVFCAALVFRWSAGNAIAAGAEDTETAEIAITLAPFDAQTHFAAGVLREGTFEAEDTAAALREFETAASLSPNNYLIWLALGRIREASGDREGAVAALARAKDLAPNYSRVRWTYGNTLLRQGEIGPAFEEMRAAALADDAYAQPIVFAATQFYDGDLGQIRSAVGTSPTVLASLSLKAATEGRFDETLEIWRSLDRDQKIKSAEIGTTVLNKMIGAKQFGSAVQFANLLADEPKYQIGSVHDGGYENGISMQNTGPFDWRIGEGQQPQVALTDGQRHNGSYSMLMIFRPAAGTDIRPISQTIAVRPDGSYRFEAFYKSDLRTAVKIRWRIATADGRVLGTTDAVAASPDWTGLYCDFAVPADADGVNVTLVRDNCAPGACAIAGNLWMDDVSMRARN